MQVTLSELERQAPAVGMLVALLIGGLGGVSTGNQTTPVAAPNAPDPTGVIHPTPRTSIAMETGSGSIPTWLLPVGK